MYSSVDLQVKWCTLTFGDLSYRGGVHLLVMLTDLIPALV